MDGKAADPVAWLRKEITDDRDYAAACLARPIFGTDFDAIHERIADCEAKLAILDEHYILRPGDTNPRYEQYSVIEPPFPSRGCGCVTCHYGAQGGVHGYGICRTVRLLLGAYRHREGYDEKWLLDAAPA